VREPEGKLTPVATSNTVFRDAPDNRMDNPYTGYPAGYPKLKKIGCPKRF
jgi:hypothetical protein